MPIPVVMPQMGESVAEGTIVRWIKQVGDVVERDEPLFEISTDKVDAEIPSPAAGVLSEIKVQEGETVPVNSVVWIVAEAGEARVAREGGSRTTPEAPLTPTLSPAGGEGGRRPGEGVHQPVPTPSAPVAARDGLTTVPYTGRPAQPWSAAEAAQLRLSPVVRKIARENRIDVRQIAGSGAGGRVTKADILAYVEAGAPLSAPAAPTAASPAPARGSVDDRVPNVAPALGIQERVERVPMSVMRRRIAEHMVLSRRTAAHVHSLFEVDFTRVSEIRDAKKQEYERAGAKLTFMSFITRAAASALKAVPVVNASVDGNDILYRKDINIGIAVALDWGLIVPVVKHADQKSLLELSKAIADLAARARAKQLSPDDVQGGTFTITNPGGFGAQFGLPIINQPQVAILAVGAVEQRPAVVNDAVAVRPRAYLVLGYDHRLIDGAVGDEFMAHLKKALEEFNPSTA